MNIYCSSSSIVLVCVAGWPVRIRVARGDIHACGAVVLVICFPGDVCHGGGAVSGGGCVAAIGFFLSLFHRLFNSSHVRSTALSIT